MEDVLSDLAWVRDSRLAFHATGVAPAWFWRTDAAHILWANGTGAACFAAPSLAALTARRFPPDHPVAVQIRRLASTLYPGGARRLERLRGFAPGIGKTTLCACSRLVVESTPGFLIVAQDPIEPAIPLAARVQFLLSDCTAPLAAFAPDGTLLAATPAMNARLAPGAGLAEIGAGECAVAALAEGSAAGETSLGRMRFVRIGHDDSAVVVASVVVAPTRVAVEARAPAPDHAVADLSDAPPVPAETRDAGQAREIEAALALTDAMPDRPAAPASVAAPEPSPLRIDLPLSDMRYPMRFVWQADPEGRFTLCSNEFAEAIGPRVAVALGRPWKDIAAELGLDPDEQVLRAIASRDTWSGITVSFPVDDSDQRLAVEMSGLPVYDRNRTFLGYRGFGVCRDAGALAAIARIRRPQALGADPALLAQAQYGADDSASATNESDAANPAELLRWSERAGQPLGAFVRSSENVVRFPALPAPDAQQGSSAPPASKSAMLHPGDNNVFHEIARQLQVRLASQPDPADGETGPETVRPPGEPGLANKAAARAASAGNSAPTAAAVSARRGASELVAFLDRLPVGFLVYRYDQPLYANPAFLAATGHAGIESFVAAGGLDSLFVEAGLGAAAGREGGARALTILSAGGEKTPVSARLFCLSWNGEAALGLMLVREEERDRAADLAGKRAEAHIRELRAILDIAFDGVAVIAPDGRIAYANRNAEALFGYRPDQLMGEAFGDLFALAGRAAVLARLERLRRGGEWRAADAEETVGRTREGQEFPLAMTAAAMPGGDRVCVVFRSLAVRKPSDGERAPAEQGGERAAAASERLSKLSHDVRTSLNSVLGFADLMLDERFGPLENERYRGYVRDIRSAAQHIATLHDIASAENGTLELAFGPVDLNGIVQSCVKAMQAEASRERIIIRMSLSQRRVTALADAASLRQIILNLLSNAIKLAGAGGQAIISTGASDDGRVVLRVRDTGSVASMTTQESAPSSEGAAPKATGFDNPPNLPLTKALAEANRGTFNVTSRANDGTLVEITFPGARLAAE